MSNWTIYIQNSSLGWDAEPAIPRPNQDMETKYVSNVTKIKLANGSNAYITPETKYSKEIFTMFWASTTSVLRTQIETYIVNGDILKIVTHTGEEFIGFFSDMSRVWFSGIEDTYDLQVSFERVE